MILSTVLPFLQWPCPEEGNGIRHVSAPRFTPCACNILHYHLDEYDFQFRSQAKKKESSEARQL